MLEMIPEKWFKKTIKRSFRTKKPLPHAQLLNKATKHSVKPWQHKCSSCLSVLPKVNWLFFVKSLLVSNRTQHLLFNTKTAISKLQASDGELEMLPTMYFSGHLKLQFQKTQTHSDIVQVFIFLNIVCLAHKLQVVLKSGTVLNHLNLGIGNHCVKQRWIWSPS